MSGSARWMLYGANGYTGKLILDEALRRGERPVLAGRRAEPIARLAEPHGLEHRAFGLEGDVARNLDGVSAVLHAAGPFSATSRPMLDGCLAAKAAYLDITGEISVFEACFARGAEAAARGVVVLPGVGFDVVPSDCLAKRLAEALPGASALELAMRFSSRPSSGTARTALEGAHLGSMVRENGELRPVPAASRVMEVPFRDGPHPAMSIPWGDLSTAYVSTRIPNIVTYMATSRAQIAVLRLARPLLGLLKNANVRAAVGRFVRPAGHGPSAEERRRARSRLWGRVRDAAGKSISATLETPEGYELTARTAVECVRRVVAAQVAAGATTPSLAFGSGFIGEFEGCDLRLD